MKHALLSQFPCLGKSCTPIRVLYYPIYWSELQRHTTTVGLIYWCLEMTLTLLSNEKIKEIHDDAINAFESNRADEVLDLLEPLRLAQKTHEVAAKALIDVVGRGCLSLEQASTLLSEIYYAHHENWHLLVRIGLVIDAARDIDDLNAPPPGLDWISSFIDSLIAFVELYKGEDEEKSLIEALTGTTLAMARQYDQLAETTYDRLVALLPDVAWAHYNCGLFCKTRGRFFEGVRANQIALSLADKNKDLQAYQWNLGICATGAGDGETALDIWRQLGNKLEPGLLGLPEGNYPSCKVRLAQHPLAERDKKHDYPGLQETIWIERLSPCHGIIRSVLYQNLGINYGDVILFDGAPITYHKYGDNKIAVFPHLSTLMKRHYQLFDFAGTQLESGILGELSSVLDSDAIIYSHTENFVILCAACWRDSSIDHEHSDMDEKHLVTGKIAAPPDYDPSLLLHQIDEALKEQNENRIYSPDLCLAAGLNDRARFEARRYNMLKDNIEG